MDEFPIPSPRQLRAIRAWFEITQAELADKCGVGATTIVYYETGKRRATDTSLDMIARQIARMGVKFTRAGDVILPN
jgi:DNA-binding XRE family transcriptional regulator